MVPQVFYTFDALSVTKPAVKGLKETTAKNCTYFQAKIATRGIKSQ